MKTQTSNNNRHLHAACLSIIIFAVFFSLPVLGNSCFKISSDTGEHAALSKNNLPASNFVAKNTRSAGVAHSPLINKHSNRHVGRLSSPHLRHPATVYSKRKFRKTISIKRSGKIHTSTRKRLMGAANPLPNKLFALLGNAVQMEALHFRPNALLPAEANWKEGIDSIIQPYINGMEEYDSVLVVGYTDNTGSIQGNLQLSTQRAKRIAAYLAQKGIPDDRIHIVAVGEYYPVASNKTSIGRNANRRVEINFLKGS